MARVRTVDPKLVIKSELKKDAIVFDDEVEVFGVAIDGDTAYINFAEKKTGDLFHVVTLELRWHEINRLRRSLKVLADSVREFPVDEGIEAEVLH